MRKKWAFGVNDTAHEVTLDLDEITGRREVRLDGEVVVEDTPFHNLSTRYDFPCAGGACELVIGRGYWVLRRSATLTVDGAEIPETPASR